MSFEGEWFTLHAKVREGTYPNLRALVPAAINPTDWRLNTRDLRAFLRATRQDSSRGVFINYENGGFTLKSGFRSVDAAIGRIAGTASGPEATPLRINHSYLLDALTNRDMTRLQFTERPPESPFYPDPTIHSPVMVDENAVIMPMSSAVAQWSAEYDARARGKQGAAS